MKPRITLQVNDAGEDVWVDDELGLILKPLGPNRRVPRTDRESREAVDSVRLVAEGTVAMPNSRGTKN